MTTTYYPQPAPAPRPFGRAYGDREFGYDEPRPVMHDNFPAAMPQPAGPSRTPSALRSGVLLLGAIAAVGAGVLVGVTLFGEDASTSTPVQPLYLVPGAAGDSAVVQTPTSIAPAPAEPSREGVLPGPDAVVLPSADNGPFIDVPLPAGSNAEPTPVLAPGPLPAPVVVPAPLPAPVVVPFPVKPAPELPKPAPPAPPKADPAPPKPAPPGPAAPAPKVDPKKLDPTIDPKLDPPKADPKLDPTIDPKLDPPKIDPTTDPKLDPPKIDPRIGPKLDPPVPAAPAPVPAPPEPPCTSVLFC